MDNLNEGQQARAIAVQAVARMHAGHAHLMTKKELFDLAEEWAMFIRTGRSPYRPNR